MGYTQHEVTSQ